jgi:hypothetical protein
MDVHDADVTVGDVREVELVTLAGLLKVRELDRAAGYFVGSSSRLCGR